jgi:hypothetical protein
LTATSAAGDDDAEAPLLASTRVEARKKQLTTAPKPRTLEERYELLEDERLADQLFERLRRRIYQELDDQARQNPQAPSIWREAGRMAPKRPYFYLKAPGEAGLLFERNGSGWVVAPAEKIVARDLFLRRGAVKEAALLFQAKEAGAVPRVQSHLFGQGLSPFAIYEKELLSRLGI